MKIVTFTPEIYKKCRIYYRNFLDIFEYFIILKGELYTSHIRITPDKTKDKNNDKYTTKEIVAIINQLRIMAETTIDFILDKKDKKKK
jgi:hypothetical protein